MKTKIVAMLLASVVTVGLLAGCGQGEQKPVSGESEVKTEEKSEEESKEESKQEEIVELKAIFGGTELDEETYETVMGEVNEYLEDAIGVHLEVDYIEFGALTETMNMEMAAGSDFDICFTSSWSNPYVAAAQKGGLYDITDLLKDRTALLEVLEEDWWWDSVKVDERIYGVCNFSQQGGNGHGAAFKKDIVDKYGYTYEDLRDNSKVEELFQLVLENEPNMFVAQSFYDAELPYYNMNEIMSFGWTNFHGIDLTGDVPTWVTVAPDNVCGEYLLYYAKKMREYYDKGYLRSDMATMGDDSVDVKSGRYFCLPGQFKIGNGIDGVVTIGDHEYYAIETNAPDIESSGTTQSMLAVGANCKNPEKALQVIELLQTDRVLYNLLVWGIEGVHYEVDENGYLVTIPGNPYETVQKNNWAVGNAALGYITKEDEATIPKDFEDRMNYFKEQNARGVMPKTFGISIDTKPVQTELAAIGEVTASYGRYWFLNCDDIDATMKEIVDKCYEVGYQTIIDEFNKQTLAWWENK